MKLIWIATTSVLFVSLFVNAAEISTHHETDFLETDADSVLNSLQADDHDHRIEKRSGSRPVPGYSEKKGDCGGHDISNVKASLQQCAAKCSRMAQCKGFLYIHQAQNYRWHRCWLKRRLCSRPRHPRGQVVSVYTKGGKSGGATKNKRKRKKKGKKSSRYSYKKGLCNGHDIGRPYSLSIKRCRAKCTKMGPACGGFSYLLPNKAPYARRCGLKSQVCPRPVPRKGMKVLTFKKTGAAQGNAGKTSNAGHQVSGYSSMKGDCGGHDIANVKASLQQCAAKCSGMAKCKGFLYIHQAQNYKWHRCWLKSRLCSKPRHPAGQVVNVYTKTSGGGGAPANQASPAVKPGPATQAAASQQQTENSSGLSDEDVDYNENSLEEEMAKDTEDSEITRAANRNMFIGIAVGGGMLLLLMLCCIISCIAQKADAPDKDQLVEKDEMNKEDD